MKAQSADGTRSKTLYPGVWILAIALFGLVLSALPALAAEPTTKPAADTARWWRGNLHTHTFWSDGDDFPESVAKWYKDNGYNFMVFTDHNVLLEGERWRSFPDQHQALLKYRNLFGDEWPQTRPDEAEGHVQVRLRALEEFRHMFEEPHEFLLIMGNEITDQHAVHVVALHQDSLLTPVGGKPEERARMLRDIVNKVDAYRASSGRNTHAILAHPNFEWAMTAEMIEEVAHLRFFEVYNTHPYVRNDGDAHRASTDRMWDIALALRLSKNNGKLLYGLATDDAHTYHGGVAGPGRGWVMVHSRQLTPEGILDALDRGDFYATTGVILRDIRCQDNAIHVEIEPQEGVRYVTEYVGTRRGFDPESTPTVDADGKEIPNTTRTYSQSIGEVLYRSTELKSSYKFAGDELYVRVRVVSTAGHVDPVTKKSLGGVQRAWGQPMVPARKFNQEVRATR